MQFIPNYLPYPSVRYPIYARNGMVCASSPQAAAAGLEAMKKGGNAMDAAVATAAALTVCEPTANGIGSDAFALIWVEKEKKLYGLNASGFSPRNISIDALKAQGHETMPTYGWAPTMVPGAPAAWAAVANRFGALPMTKSMAPAIRYAREGYPASPNLARMWKRAYDKFTTVLQGEEYAAWFDTFTPDGRCPAAGEMIRLPDHADTLEEIARTQAESFYREHPQGFHASNPVDAWKGYVSGWNSMDAIYRSFCTSFDECQLSAEEVPDALRDAAERTAERVENLYVNWFLPGVNGCWIGCCEPDWAEKGHVAGIPLQREFYNRYPSRNSRDFKRTVVIVSDGMRYEVGAELARRLEQETKGSVTLEACQSVFPSVTEFGMAALLPQSEISYSWDSGDVFADGMPTRTTKEREAVLQKAVPGARALTAQDLRAGNRAARRELVGSAPLVYIYQDKIDSTGEKPKLEHDVFTACESAVDELVALCKIVVNDLGINRVFVTADHGFLYTRRPLKEHDKIAKADIGSGDVQLHRRHVLSREAIDSNILVKMNMEDIHGGEYYGLALRECIRLKSVAGNKNYAHGGVSLQEMCVPVIEFRNHRSNSKARVDQEKASLSLVSTSRRITSSMFHVDLYQREPVSGKVLPCEYELCLTDGSGNPVTDIQKAHADMATPDERARVSRPMFTLKAGIDYPPDERYFLVCRDKETGEITWKEEFTIDMAFAPSVDFGF